MGSRRSMRQNAVVSRVAPPLQGSNIAQDMPSKLARARAQASHSHAPHIKQPAPVTLPTSHGFPSSSSWPVNISTIWSNHRAGGHFHHISSQI
ncbi:hypothetical protein ACFX1X_040137 [Malus domestica]